MNGLYVVCALGHKFAGWERSMVINMGQAVMYISNESVIGGAAQSLIDMLKGIRAYIRPVVIIPEKGMIEEWLKALDVPYYIIPFSVGYGKIGECTQEDKDKNFVDNYSAALQLIPIIKKEDISLIHTNSSVSNIGAMAALLTGKPHIWHIREVLEEHFGYEFYDERLKISLFHCADAIITISDYVKCVYLRKYGIHSVRVYNGLDIDRFRDDICYEKKGNNTFLLAGDISAVKGQWDAVKAVETLVAEGMADIRLVLIGKGTQKAVWAIKKYIEKRKLERNIQVLPFQKNLSEFRKNCVFSITGSKMEALGRCTIEAMLAGNIVIGADTGGTLELIGRGQGKGYLYRQGDYRDLADVMKRAMEDRKDGRLGCIAMAQEFAIQNFNLGTYIEGILPIYQNAMEKGKKTSHVCSEKLRRDLSKRYDSLKGMIQKQEDAIGTEKKFQRLFLLENQWLHIRQGNHTLAEYFLQRDIREIAIYGMGYLGCNLYDELEDSEVEVKYVIDKNPEDIEKIMHVVNPDGEIEEVDAIVVTVVEEEESIKKWLQRKTLFQILGLSEILGNDIF